MFRKYRQGEQAKEADKLGPKGERSGYRFGNCLYGDVAPPVQRAGLSHPLIGNNVERGNPVSSPGVLGR
jgi:hypothetical protein